MMLRCYLISYLHEQASAAMKQTYQILNNRINQFGVAQLPSTWTKPMASSPSKLRGATDPDRYGNTCNPPPTCNSGKYTTLRIVTVDPKCRQGSSNYLMA